MSKLNSNLTKFLITSLLFLILILSIKGVFGSEYPHYNNYINDFANVLNDGLENKLNKELKEYDKKTSNQIAVITIDSTNPETIEEYSIHLADKWAPGTKDKDNGVLMVFAIKDRKMRIEVGRGLEGELTDIESKHILDDVIRPKFKQGDYESGVSNGIHAVMTSIATESATLSEQQPDIFLIMFIIFIIVLFIIIVIASSPYTPIGGQGTWGMTDVYSSSGGSFFSSGNNSNSSDTSFGGGGFSGGGSSSSW